MPYSAEISRRQPACILFLIDQSHSMSDAWSSRRTSKAEGLATIVNKALSNITIESAKGEGINDYFHVGIVGYGSSVGTTRVLDHARQLSWSAA